MSGTAVTRALQQRFETVRRTEVERLKRKLGGLSEEDRQSAEAIIADVIHGLARVPSRALSDSHHPHELEAVVQLFRLNDLAGEAGRLDA